MALPEGPLNLQIELRKLHDRVEVLEAAVSAAAVAAVVDEAQGSGSQVGDDWTQSGDGTNYPETTHAHDQESN